MKVTAWNNGKFYSSGAGYGIRITKTDRDQYFLKKWNDISIIIDNDKEIDVNISKSFWRKCPELRHVEIGKSFIKKGIAPWSKGHPPSFDLEFIENKKYRLKI